jgi:hypothetical protein
MKHIIEIKAIIPNGGDSVIIQGLVNGTNASANASRAVLGSFSTAALANNYLAYLLLHHCPQGVDQKELIATTGTVTL